jgi:YesN/AraC family two-component response regulator
VKPIIDASLLPEDVESKMGKICEFICSEDPYERIAAKGHLLAFFAELLPKVEMVSQTADLDNTQKLLIYCIEHYTEPITLDSVSRALHLNKYYISHVFKERMDIGFADFISSLRVEHACSLLKKDSSITEVAYASGFSSIRTFNRQFVRKMATTPTEYVKNISADSVIVSYG